MKHSGSRPKADTSVDTCRPSSRTSTRLCTRRPPEVHSSRTDDPEVSRTLQGRYEASPWKPYRRPRKLHALPAFGKANCHPPPQAWVNSSSSRVRLTGGEARGQAMTERTSSRPKRALLISPPRSGFTSARSAPPGEESRSTVIEARSGEPSRHAQEKQKFSTPSQDAAPGQLVLVELDPETRSGRHGEDPVHETNRMGDERGRRRVGHGELDEPQAG